MATKPQRRCSDAGFITRHRCETGLRGAWRTSGTWPQFYGRPHPNTGSSAITKLREQACCKQAVERLSKVETLGTPTISPHGACPSLHCDVPHVRRGVVNNSNSGESPASGWRVKLLYRKTGIRCTSGFDVMTLRGRRNGIQSTDSRERPALNFPVPVLAEVCAGCEGVRTASKPRRSAREHGAVHRGLHHRGLSRRGIHFGRGAGVLQTDQGRTPWPCGCN